MKDRKSLFMFVAAFLILLLIAFICCAAPGNSIHFSNEDITPLNDGWQTDGADGTAVEIALPAQLDVEKNHEYRIFKVIGDSEFKNGSTLCVRSSLQTLRILVDGRQIYAEGFPEQGWFHTPVASMWNLVRLPGDIQGKTLTLVFSSPYSSISGIVNPLFYGTKSAILFYIVRVYGPRLLITLVTILIGLVLIAVSFVIRSILDRGFLYLGLFAVFVSMWLLAESRMLQFFTGSQFYIGGSAYMALAIFPIPMLLYVRETVVTHYKPVFLALSLVFVADFIACVTLQALGVITFFEWVPVTNTLIMLSIVVTIGILAVEIKKYKNSAALRFSCYICLLLVFAAMELITFFRADFDYTSVFLRIGLMLYICILGLDSVMRLRRLIHKSEEAQFYERMAYEDILTGGKNRAAYVRDLNEALSSPNTRNLRLVVMDLNGLKTINDRYGHVTGDSALRISYRCIHDAFGALGQCYRIGGDEFACILPDCDDGCYENAMVRFSEMVTAANREIVYTISIAVGSAVYNPCIDTTSQVFLARADRTMYHNKREAAQSVTAVSC